jgi:repressor LexA
MGRTPTGETRAKVYAYVRERLLAGSPPTVREVQDALGFRAPQTARQHLEALVQDGRLVVQRGVSRGYRLAETETGRRSGGRGARASRVASGTLPGAPFGISDSRDARGGTGGRLAPPPSPRTWVPILGRVQAGALTFAGEDLEGYVPLEANEISPDDAALEQKPQRGRTKAARGGTLGDHFALRVSGESMTGAGIMPGDIVIVRRQERARSGEIVVALVGDEATIKRLRLRRGRVELWAEHPDFAPIVPEDDVAILGRVVEVRRRY